MTETKAPAAPQTSTHDSQLRDAITAQIKERNLDRAIQYARLLLQAQPSLRTLRFLRRIAESGEAPAFGLRPFRVALLSSFSIEFAHDALIAHSFINGIAVKIYQSGFNTFRQELLDSNSGLYQSHPDLVILAVEGEDWEPAAYGQYTTPSTEFPAIPLEPFFKEIAGLLQQFRATSNAPLLVHNFAPPVARLLGILDIKSRDGQSRLVGRLNDILYEACSQVTDIHLLDYAGLVARHGAVNWYDARMRLYAHAPIHQSMLGALAKEYAKYCRALVGLSRKCLVLDLDNTLWGGIIGEEGLSGIQLGPHYPGNAFVEFQRGILALRNRGVILAIASKNNPQDVDEVFEKHPFMVLKHTDFAEFQVHWEPKSESLARIARKLNIGLDHLVFVDDNPAECEHVRTALPMVTVLQLPPQPERYLESLFEDGWFDTLSLSEEDQKRATLYEQRDQAEALREASADLETYYRDLDMVLTLNPVNPENLARAAQLTQKTNQFNVTTQRYSDAEIAHRMTDPDWLLITAAVADRFGDNGIVGLVMARLNNESLDIDTFLLSCRIIGRTVETAMLAHLCEIANRQGAMQLRGTIIPTAKNIPVRDLFKRHGFTPEIEEPDGTSIWRLELSNAWITWPAWFKVKKTC